MTVTYVMCGRCGCVLTPGERGANTCTVGNDGRGGAAPRPHLAIIKAL